MYLERCVLPKFYILILERLLETFDSETQPVHRVEVLCSLGHESRKEGDKQKYQKLMEEAEKVHTTNHEEFETKALSEVYFCNSCARFLSDKKDPKENKRIEQETETALKVCREKLGDHPETAATLLLAGIIAKRRQERDEAEQKLTEALELFKKCLEVMEIFHDLGMSGNKESVLTLKNFAMCHMRKKNFDEAMELLTKAEQVSEQELEADHKWKVQIKTEKAILHERMGNPDLAKAVMRDGLLMGKKLNLPIDKMGNKDEIRKFINSYRESFTEEEFPRIVQTIPQANETWIACAFKGPKDVSVDPKKFQNIKRLDVENLTLGPGGRRYGARGGTGTVGAESGLRATADVSAATAADSIAD
ncbi:hypothetical protein ACROYT_G008872 [Oculina patagonica]